MQDCKCSTVQQVPMASFEAAQARHNHLLITLIIGWTVTVIVLGFALICTMSYTEEAVETTMEVTQDADNSGSNYFANGALTNDSTPDGQDNDQENN